MDKLYGKIFKKVRIERGYSIKEVADSIVSNSTISQFENGKSTTSIEKFFHALANMNISPEDYFLRVEKENQEDISSYQFLLKKSVDTENIYTFKEILGKMEQRYKEIPESKYLRL